ncbi:MAG: porphobilinogen synthase [Candidatus Omnitrophica bacterium]|nr:porphobilinogen synthase [Candidatus Omnitrophota bacterium]MCB9721002.1 porphobilinogen synthase [Candidatus Omnitrophota bacterium]
MTPKKSISMPKRPRRNRRSASIRDLTRETMVTPADLVYPIFVTEGRNVREAISSMPGIKRLSLDLLAKECREIARLGIPAVALFPKISDRKKDSLAAESKNPRGLIPRSVKEIKAAVPELTVITDVAMDPYSSDGHDGVVRDGQIVNDETLPVLADMAVAQAQAGADFVAPSDMMDGRIGYIRNALDEAGLTETGILAYSAKYASAYYGPFRDALDSAPKAGDKKTYQMDYANVREAVREVLLDEEEGADIVMVKPAGLYLDVIARIRAVTELPVAAYHVSGEYALIKAAAAKGWVDEDAAVCEALTAIKRAGADIIFTYFAKAFARSFQSSRS